MTSAKKHQLILTVITIGFVLFIFSNSMQNADTSGAKSGGVVKLLTNLFAATGVHIPVSEYIIRKTGHFTEYLILGVLLLLTLKTYTKNLVKHIFVPLFFGLAAAVADESIQLFVNGRSSQVSDVVLDFCGVLTGILLLGLILKLHARKRKPKA